jgi:hypothetical protein
MDRPLPLAPGVATIAVLSKQMIQEVIVNQVGSPQAGDPTQVTGYYTQLGSCHGPAGGAPSAGVGGGVPAERIPRVTPPNLARRGVIANKFKKD